MSPKPEGGEGDKNSSPPKKLGVGKGADHEFVNGEDVQTKNPTRDENGRTKSPRNAHPGKGRGGEDI